MIAHIHFRMTALTALDFLWQNSLFSKLAESGLELLSENQWQNHIINENHFH